MANETPGANALGLKGEKLLDVLLSEEVLLINKYASQVQKIQDPEIRETLTTLLTESGYHASVVAKIIAGENPDEQHHEL